MNDRISPAEWMLLSAYLDGQVNASEKARVETWLHTRPEIAEAYRSLRNTQLVLQHAPQHKAPRNFTLTAEMLPQPRRSFWLVPTLRFSSLAAAIAAVILFINPFAQSAAVAPMAAEAPQEALALSAKSGEEVTADSLSAEPTPTPAIIFWGTPANDTAAGIGGADYGGGARGMGGGGAEIEMFAMAATPANSERSMVMATEAPAEAPAPLDMQADSAAAGSALAENAEEGSGPILGVQSVPEAAAQSMTQAVSESASFPANRIWAGAVMAFALAALLTSFILAKTVKP
jgi:hypothetical protein